MTFKAHYDGKVIVPDEPVELSAGQTLIVSASAATQPPTGLTGLTGSQLAELLSASAPIWQDIGDPIEFARKLREESNRPRYFLDPD
jgi:hypothetical protein